jgi:glycine dehydrogenase subunit 1
MEFIPNTAEQQKEMLASIGLTMADLFRDVPPELMAKSLNLPAGLSEQEVRDRLADLADKNSIDLTLFLGGGFYDHFIPSAVYSIISRSEFYTAYTPYQPEISQGTLQAIYEFQSTVCRLTDMEVANASLYDGGTALYEAMMMALRITDRNKVIVDDSVNPIYRVMLHSYTSNLQINLEETHCTDGLANRAEILDRLDDKTAAVIVQNPNFFGCIDDFTDLAEAAHDRGALLLVSCYPISLGILKTPGAMGADIVTAEGQSLGLPMSFGGPYLGIMTSRKQYVRKMPGRIVGETLDREGRRAFVLTLQAREQHIRR